MRQFFIFCLAALMLLGCMNPHTRPPQYVRTPTEMAYINDSVVALVEPYLDRPMLRVFCSGQFVSRNRVLTAAHCVDGVTDGQTVQIVTYRDYTASQHFMSDETHTTEFSVWRIEEDWDMALLVVVDEDELPLHSVLRVAPAAPEQGEAVVLVGHPRGLPWSITEGMVSSAYRTGWAGEPEDNNPLFIQHDANASPGNSGGALLNHRNELAGVLVQGWMMENHLSMSVHTSLVQKFLRGS